MIALIVYIFSALVALALGCVAGWTDFKGLKIPNQYPGLIILLFLLAYGASYYGNAEIFAAPGNHILAGVIVFVITFALFQFNVFGGGDSKLLTAFALWVGLSGLSVLIFYMALFGALLGVSALYIQKRKPFFNPPEASWVGQLQAGKSKVPYGIAITLGAIIAFTELGYLSPQTWALFLEAS